MSIDHFTPIGPGLVSTAGELRRIRAVETVYHRAQTQTKKDENRRNIDALDRAITLLDMIESNPSAFRIWAKERGLAV